MPSIECPVFITSAKNEQKQWQGIYDQIKSQKTFYLQTEGRAHGSKSLWPDKKGNEGYWDAVMAFLNSLD